MPRSTLSTFVALLKQFSNPDPLTLRSGRRRWRTFEAELLEARTLLTVSLIGVPGVSLQIDYTNAVAASPSFHVSLSGRRLYGHVVWRHVRSGECERRHENVDSN